MTIVRARRERRGWTTAQIEANRAIHSMECMLRQESCELTPFDQDFLRSVIEVLKEIRASRSERLRIASRSSAAGERSGRSREPRNGTSGVTGVENPDGEP